MGLLDPQGLMVGGIITVLLGAVLFVTSDDRAGDIGAVVLAVLGAAAVIVGTVALIVA